MDPATPAAPDTESTRTLRVTGIVQGVGYRPFVATLARELGIRGWVVNDSHGVLVHATAIADVLDRFQGALSTAAPPLARVDGVAVVTPPTDPPPPAPGDGSPFEIRASADLGAATTIVAPDSHVCDDCLGDVLDPHGRRYRYPFTNCTNCGPRYSIVLALPYDRATTTMAPFTMCRPCRTEYEDPADRRYHAQPNACGDCGPRLTLVDRDRHVVATGDDALRRTGRALADGTIVAVKSVGGFHLAVDARAAEAVATLRRRKRRDSKPFAVMTPDLATARRLVQIDPTEAALLEAPSRPIVLLRKRPGSLPESVAPRNPDLGVMLPSTPLHHLLFTDSGLDALVMTSGNLSGYPIAHRNDDAEEQLLGIADLVLHHDRDIHQRVDDSVVRCSPDPGGDGTLLTFIRRGRGYAPYSVRVDHVDAPLVGYGAELKTSVAVGAAGTVHVSQHIGDLKNDENVAFHQAAADHLQRLYGVTAASAVSDLHPAFHARILATSGRPAADVVSVQHHHAHMAACMAENGLHERSLGVVFDGAGYGPDGTTWGAEFLLGDLRQVRRVAHLRAVPLLGGDVAVREPVRTGFAMALAAFGEVDRALTVFPALSVLSEQERVVFAAMARRGINSPPASSMGRFFDGIAALLGICGRAEYEAQGPIELEGLLGRDLSPVEGYTFGLDTEGDVTVVDPDPVVRALAADLAHDVPVELMSRRVHSGVVDLVRTVAVTECAAGDTDRVVLSGGVFLNEFLTVNCVRALRAAGLRPVHHRLVPPNDGGIALGQVAVAAARRRPTMMDA